MRFTREADGHVSVLTSPDYRPLEDFLETDIGGELSELRFLAERARHARAEPWGFGGDTCHVTVGGDDVLVENDFTGQRVTLPRGEFLRILDEYAAASAGH
ncbi:hypothetical protein [Actinophytocola sp.]|uniref:hypothetical protein n=1 Tax=Actinophytocola sp. TaxID=1872138 RepID=UPI00389B0D07